MGDTDSTSDDLEVENDALRYEVRTLRLALMLLVEEMESGTIGDVRNRLSEVDGVLEKLQTEFDIQRR